MNLVEEAALRIYCDCPEKGDYKVLLIALAVRAGISIAVLSVMVAIVCAIIKLVFGL